MKVSTLLFALPLVSALPELSRRGGEAKKPDCPTCCLTAADVDQILDQYGLIYTSRDEKTVTQVINTIIDDDFKEYDESNNLGMAEVVAKNKQEFLTNALAMIKAKPVLKDLKIDIKYAFNDCNNGAIRFEASGAATGELEVGGVVIPTNTTFAPVGTPIAYKGTAIYHFDCEKKKIKEIYQSADSFNFLIKIGFPLGPPCGPPA